MRRDTIRRLAATALLVWAGLVIGTAPVRAFTVNEVLTNGTPDDPSDDLRDAARWSNLPGSLVADGVRGLGGGLEYAVGADLCERLLPRFLDEPRPECDQLHAAIDRDFHRWADGHPGLRFADVSDRIAARLPSAVARDPNVGAEIDLVALAPDAFLAPVPPADRRRIAYQTVIWGVADPPAGAGGRVLPGRTLTGADIVLNAEACYHLDLSLSGHGCHHFETLVLQAIGAALGLGHPDSPPGRNFDLDDDPTDPIPIDCDDPLRGLRPSPRIDPGAVMASTRGQPMPVRPALAPDDLGGRDFLYSACAEAASVRPQSRPRSREGERADPRDGR